MRNVIMCAFNHATEKFNDNEITPRFIEWVNIYMKARFDGRYKVKFRAASNRSAIVEYQNRCYYLYYDWKQHIYVCENS